MYSVLNTLSENLTLYTFLLVFKIVESLQCILKSNKYVSRDILSNILKECKLTFFVLTDYINKSFELVHCLTS